MHDVHAVFQLFQDAMSVFADSLLLHNDMGSLLYRLEHYQEAMGYFRNALDIDQDFLRARENFDGISNLLVERWHFRMLMEKKNHQQTPPLPRDEDSPLLLPLEQQLCW